MLEIAMKPPEAAEGKRKRYDVSAEIKPIVVVLPTLKPQKDATKTLRITHPVQISNETIFFSCFFLKCTRSGSDHSQNIYGAEEKGSHKNSGSPFVDLHLKFTGHLKLLPILESDVDCNRASLPKTMTI